ALRRAPVPARRAAFGRPAPAEAPSDSLLPRRRRASVPARRAAFGRPAPAEAPSGATAAQPSAAPSPRPHLFEHRFDYTVENVLLTRFRAVDGVEDVRPKGVPIRKVRADNAGIRASRLRDGRRTLSDLALVAPSVRDTRWARREKVSAVPTTAGNLRDHFSGPATLGTRRPVSAPGTGDGADDGGKFTRPFSADSGSGSGCGSSPCQTQDTPSRPPRPRRRVSAPSPGKGVGFTAKRVREIARGAGGEMKSPINKGEPQYSRLGKRFRLKQTSAFGAGGGARSGPSARPRPPIFLSDYGRAVAFPRVRERETRRTRPKSATRLSVPSALAGCPRRLTCSARQL
ncbi:MAG: hypothetical protein BJ554DRAFT_2813, partial [Olpidium bornovanus]